MSNFFEKRWNAKRKEDSENKKSLSDILTNIRFIKNNALEEFYLLKLIKQYEKGVDFSNQNRIYYAGKSIVMALLEFMNQISFYLSCVYAGAGLSDFYSSINLFE